ncbi:hypothetical protein Cni_G19888 [Canna indica]|uniref:SCP domain-containing protein n=1 Tax=Canna indica TaxID=4628 RepID=A0AAQ3KLE8_9LILI|nr:hypothetical protein Cni_G19888 [Canna indica]
MASTSSTLSILFVLLTVHVVHGGQLSSTAMQFLNPHNALRQRMRLPPLQWSAALAKVALGYAMQRRADCALVHSTMNYGENLFWGQGKSWHIGDAVAAWAAEKPYYDYGRNTCARGKECHHYTQMVWRATKRVGCAKIYCNSGDTYVVCEYDPHGNVIGQKPY